MAGIVSPSPPSHLSSSGHMWVGLEGRGNHGRSQHFDAYCLVRGTCSWRWGESNPLRRRFANSRFGWSRHVRPAQGMFLTMPVGTFHGLSKPPNRFKIASAASFPRHVGALIVALRTFTFGGRQLLATTLRSPVARRRCRHAHYRIVDPCIIGLLDLHRSPPPHLEE